MAGNAWFSTQGSFCNGGGSLCTVVPPALRRNAVTPDFT